MTRFGRGWRGFPPAKDELLANLLLDADLALIPALLQRFSKERNLSCSRAEALPARRTVGELLRAAEGYAKERRRIEAKHRAEAEEQRRRQTAIARKKHLDGLVGREPKLWAEVAGLVATKQAKGYEQAAKILLDLRDLDGRKQGGDFRRHLGALREEHGRKPAFLRRLREAGL